MGDFNIETRMGLDISEFERNLKTAEGGLKTLKEIAAAIGVGIGISQVSNAVSKIVGHASGIRDAADSIGLTTDTLQGLQFALTQNGGTAEMASEKIAKLQVKISEADEGSKDAIASFAKFGISVKDNLGNLKGTEQVLLEIADAMARAANETERAAIANTFFGRNSQRLIPTLSLGGGGLREAIRNAPKVSQDEIDAIESLGDTLSKWKDFEMSAITRDAGVLVNAAARIGAGLGYLSAQIKPELVDFMFAGPALLNFLRSHGFASDEPIADAALSAEESANLRFSSIAARIRARAAITKLPEPDVAPEIAQRNLLLYQKQNEAQLAQMNTLDRLNSLESEREALLMHAQEIGVGTKDGLDAQIKAEEKLVQLVAMRAKAGAEIEQNMANLAERFRAQQKAEELADRQRMDRRSGFVESFAGWANARQALESARADRLKFSEAELQDMFVSRRRSPELWRQQQDLWRSQDLAQQARGLVGVNDERAKELMSQSDALRATITYLKENERLPFKNLEDAAKKTASTLDDIFDQFDNGTATVSVLGAP